MGALIAVILNITQIYQENWDQLHLPAWLIFKNVSMKGSQNAPVWWQPAETAQQAVQAALFN